MQLIVGAAHILPQAAFVLGQLAGRDASGAEALAQLLELAALRLMLGLEAGRCAFGPLELGLELFRWGVGSLHLPRQSRDPRLRLLKRLFGAAHFLLQFAEGRDVALRPVQGLQLGLGVAQCLGRGA